MITPAGDWWYDYIRYTMFTPTLESMMASTKKAATATKRPNGGFGPRIPPSNRVPAVAEWEGKWRFHAESHGVVVREEDRAEFVLMCDRAVDLGLPIAEGVKTFLAARAAMAGVLVGKQAAKTYIDDRRRGFAAARHRCLVVGDN